jgi:hypothetical protein
MVQNYLKGFMYPNKESSSINNHKYDELLPQISCETLQPPLSSDLSILTAVVGGP